ncbi:MAG TPA: hypothetical protein VN701_01610 [Candidatus Paceibacterota bacterium]|nr:hypothetical protein [Candidatus Paceibacterota bacterium]
MKLRLYVGCALTEAPPEFRERVEELKALLRPRYDVLEFLGLMAGTPADVYETDIQANVCTADVMLAICDYPSTGLGFELAVAVRERRIPVLAVAHEKKRITRLVLGLPEHHGNAGFKTYRDLLGDVPRLLEQKVESEALV